MQENYVIKLIASAIGCEFSIEMEENVDSFGEHINYYYGDDNEYLEQIVEDKINVELFKKDYEELLEKANMEVPRR